MDEKKIKSIIKPYLEQCRPGDWNHAKRVVNWVKFLGKKRNDLDLLIIAAYIHDIGWTGLVPNDGLINIDEMLKLEPRANENTEKMVSEVMLKMDFKKEDIAKVVRLIEAADEHGSSTDDEAIIVDADSLSKLCLEHVKEKYNSDSYQKIITMWEREMPSRFKTTKAQEIYSQLLEKLKQELILNNSITRKLVN